MKHWERILELLSDGRVHSHRELYALNVVAHSRIADLRRRGYVVNAWRDEDPYTKETVYLYQLVSAPKPASHPSSGGAGHGAGSGAERPGNLPPPPRGEGLPISPEAEGDAGCPTITSPSADGSTDAPPQESEQLSLEAA